MNMQHWHYFLSLEEDFIETFKYVEFDVRNDSAFSNEFVKLLLLAGSEIDVIAKMLCTDVRAGTRVRNIDDYRAILASAFPGIHTVIVEAPMFGRTSQPWASWGASAGENPNWWRTYNAVKHGRDTAFPEACQKNAFESLCGLLVLLLYYYRSVKLLQPVPRLLLVEGLARSWITPQTLRLPGT